MCSAPRRRGAALTSRGYRIESHVAARHAQAAGLQEAILTWASSKPSAFAVADEDAFEGEPTEGYLAATNIAEKLEAAIEDELVECEEKISATEVGKALGHLLTRQQQGEAWLGILFRKSHGRGEWRIMPAERRVRDARAEAASALSAKISACVHRCGVTAVDSAAPLCCSAALLLC